MMWAAVGFNAADLGTISHYHGVPNLQDLIPSLPLPPFRSSADTFQLLHPVSNVTLDFSWGFFF